MNTQFVLFTVRVKCAKEPEVVRARIGADLTAEQAAELQPSGFDLNTDKLYAWLRKQLTQQGYKQIQFFYLDPAYHGSN